MVMAITKSASLNPSLEEGEVEEGDADSIASSREGSLTDEPLSPSDSTTTTSSGASKSKAMHKAGARDGSAMSKSSSTTPTASSKPVQNSTSHSPPKPAPPENISAELNAADLERAKTLVLDLLGWGVPPEYLVDAGVSGQVIYRVFTELNLRLPKNLAVPPQVQKQKT